VSLLINAHNLEASFAGRSLFSKLSFGIEEKQRIGLIGPNGAGKSTLLKIIAGKLEPFEGSVSRRQKLRVAYLEQQPQIDGESTLLEFVLQGALDPYDWQSQSKAYELLSRFGFEAAGLSESSLLSSMSGGWKKKAALARELMREPDLLLMDEPTNHLDVESILWLEEYLARVPFSTLIITHDRQFLNRISNQIWELDRRNKNGLLKVEGDYASYCEVKAEQIANLERREATLENTLRRETEWLRRGPKARTTKQQARIDRAEDLADDVANLNELTRRQNVGLSFESLDGTPKKLIEVKGASKSFGERSVLKKFSLTIERGRKIGLLGPNGAGKSTLIKILLGQMPSDTGEVLHSERLELAYFAQDRDLLDPNLTVMRTLCPEGDHVKFQGNFIHIRSYLDRFLFSALQMENAVGKLSGGEQARLLLAKLMLSQANILVLDEPTNDLDIPTLNILEERLTEFGGALILVTHDRYFLDQVCDEILVIDDGEISRFYGVEQWEKWQKSQAAEKAAGTSGSKNKNESVVTSAPKKKPSFKEQREWEQMEAKIADAERRLSEATAAMESPQNAQNLAKLGSEVTALSSEIESLYARWSELESLFKT
jgi:ATP-binding cassette subfamily F protein uup